MSVKLLSDWVAIRPDKRGETKLGSIVIPATADHPEERNWIETGTVVFVGPGDRETPDGSRRDMSVKPGDRVLFVGGRAGTEHMIGDEKLYVIHEEQFVLAVLEPEEAVA